MTAASKAQLNLRLDAVTRCKIEKIAHAENRTLANMIDYLVRQEIRRFELDNGEVFVTDEDLDQE